MKRLTKDGEKKVIKASANWSMFKIDKFRVEAERVDCDTPYINLAIDFNRCEIGEDGMVVISLEDFAALDLIERLQTAIDILPSSK